MKSGQRFIIPVMLCLCCVSATGTADNEVAAIAGGTFEMGTSGADIPVLKERYDVDFPGVFENEVPAHRVSLDGFRIDRFEVTNARYADFVDENPQWHPEHVAPELHNGRYLEHWQHGQYPEGKDHHPVVFVSWHAAQSYCRWRDGRLPTEAEWEYVARAGNPSEFPWGDELPSPVRANYSASGINDTTPVGTYPPNAFGIYDLAGNVWEFLYDEWRPQYPEDAQENPVAGDFLDESDVQHAEGRRAVRGASYGGSIVNIRTRWRDSHVVSNAIEFVGFRCAYAGVAAD